MTEIIEAIQKSAIRIAQTIQTTDFGYSDSANESGDQQLKLDVQSDLIIEEQLSKTSSVKVLASEEKSEPVTINEQGKYLVGYDPLDGSSLVDVNLSVGSIFGIYENGFHGKNLKAAVYVVYGPRVEMVISTIKAERFILQNGAFHFMEELQLDKKGKLNAPGGTQQYWYPHHKALIENLFSQGYRLRYSGGMVPDLHQILVKKGGLFSYPGTEDKPKGKLRKVFEVFPFAHVYEKAGGEAIDDQGNRLLDLTTQAIHDTTPCFFGSRYEIGKVREYYEK
ncbi:MULTISPECIES: class 1 fructose-bisphosphatase [unclassified Nitratiruptor]|uniref:class 1 fructose-bisphosphatase n=1 Tax=unclassified Nitratiruptor TaxID=2624044 RepID=UPI0019154AA5|nr:MULTISPECIES: class 1 fructose-bisphosphatase [unclassified Nitratiruptor]BCD60483.1 fructose-1,6-bisphosphatase I [Nitratiruptor sp. YY08-10]BCD64028.1 fructose-1,6-bisphosphatase I [Nitratiruptor sp. YY08-14]